ncbi:MAG: N-acetyltransferase [Bacteroidetes bacterium]|nr:MAG: N-acetyltransferase [Bacteroidota bacterium]
MNVELHTPRLLLRPLTEADLPDLFILDSNPEVHRYLSQRPISSMQEAEAYLAYILSQYAEYGIGRLAIIEKASGEFVGWSGLKYETEVRTEFDYYDLGYRLKQNFWGQGIATEAARESLRFGFEDLQLTKICAGADVNNKASNYILGQKLGMRAGGPFTYDGILCHWYELTLEDWQNRNH